MLQNTIRTSRSVCYWQYKNKLMMKPCSSTSGPNSVHSLILAKRIVFLYTIGPDQRQHISRITLHIPNVNHYIRIFKKISKCPSLRYLSLIITPAIWMQQDSMSFSARFCTGTQALLKIRNLKSDQQPRLLLRASPQLAMPQPTELSFVSNTSVTNEHR